MKANARVQESRFRVLIKDEEILKVIMDRILKESIMLTNRELFTVTRLEERSKRISSYKADSESRREGCKQIKQNGQSSNRLCKRRQG